MTNQNTLAEFASEKRIFQMLCRLRVKLAMERNKEHLIHLHSTATRYNYHSKKLTRSNDLLCSLFPPRKKWKKPCKERRNRNGEPRSTSEKTMQSLLVTLYHYEREKPMDPSMVRLRGFIKEIQDSIFKDFYKITQPVIIPKLKDDKLKEAGENICRPIASFALKDKVILSIVNRYLTVVLEPIFLPQSFAFRGKREIDGQVTSPTHHDAVRQILNYREKFSEHILHVAECDMKKFFDSVNHTVIKRTLNRCLKHKAVREQDEIDLKHAKRILYDYLEVYTFNRNVLRLNNQKYFDRYQIPQGKFEWVAENLIDAGHYKRLKTAKIGIPQGGALSGLIANVVLHDIDKRVLRYDDGRLMYVRFCDDMLLIHPEKEKCAFAFNAYIEGLNSRKLVPHAPVNNLFVAPKLFWKEKSKHCYQWNDNRVSGSPWIGFVGYEIHFKGDIRVRKSSLEKEMKKQFKVVGDLKAVLNDSQCRSSARTIYESVANRLIGMSVGRVTLWNYKTVKPEMCWASGYKLLTKNKYSEIQLRRLDASRNRLLAKMRKKTQQMANAADDDKDKKENKASQPIYYGQPFSYYYQVFKPKS